MILLAATTQIVAPSSGGGSLLPIIIGIVGGGGLLGGGVAFMKLRPEKDSIVVTTAQAALMMQTDITAGLRADLTRAVDRLDDCEHELATKDEMIHARDVTIDELLARLRVAEGREWRGHGSS